MGSLHATIFRKGALPVLERVASFRFQRHKVLANNIANVETPFYKRKDMSEKSFGASLKRSIKLRDRKPVRTFDYVGNTSNYTTSTGGYGGVARKTGGLNMLRHDENNVSLEREMAEIARNALFYKGAVTMMKKQLTLIADTIRQGQR